MRSNSKTGFTFNLSDEQRQLCTWVAEQARAGVRRVRYTDVTAAMTVGDDGDITRVLREIRERRDRIYAMVHSPVVNHRSPYFDLHRDADHIWDEYCQAEAELPRPDSDGPDLQEINAFRHAGQNRVACAV